MYVSYISVPCWCLSLVNGPNTGEGGRHPAWQQWIINKVVGGRSHSPRGRCGASARPREFSFLFSFLFFLSFPLHFLDINPCTQRIVWEIQPRAQQRSYCFYYFGRIKLSVTLIYTWLPLIGRDRGLFQDQAIISKPKNSPDHLYLPGLPITQQTTRV